MTTLKRRLSIVLAAAMIASNMTSVAMADVESPTGWQLEEDGWHFYRFSDGKEMKNRERMTGQKWYSFDTNGVMYSDALIDVNTDEVNTKGESVTGKRYAFPDGHLAEGHTWVLLNQDGTKHYHDNEDGECSGIWYFFQGDNLVDSDTNQLYEFERGVMVTAKEGKTEKEKEIDHTLYCFDTEGRMYSRKWNADKTSYYQYNGERAENKYLYLDSQWYYFNENGKAEKVMAGTASASNAELATVKSIVPVEKSLSGALGETLKVSYRVNLATSSNAEEEPVYSEDYHNAWVLQKRSGKFTQPSIEEDGLCTFDYTISSLDPEKLYLVIDGEKSGAVTITVSKEDTTSASVSDIAGLLNGEKTSDVGISVDSVRNSLITYYKADAESVKDEYTESDAIEAIETLESAYVMEKQITVSTPISDDAKAILPENSSVTVTGAALNAETKGKVELKVDTGSVTDKKLENIKEDMSASGTLVTAPFDITFYVNGSKKTSLTLPVIISMPLPEGFEADDMALYHIHGSSLDEVDFTEEDGTISFAADKFSTYVFVKETTDDSKPNDDNTTDNTTTPPAASTSSRQDDDDDDSYSSRRSKGQWMKNSTGWWYQNPNGSYPSNTWMQLEYANIKDWYRFNLQGYLHTGWFTDSDGEIYYLNPVSNGFLGAMLTGWHQIDGYWYYFNPVSNGHKGALLRNTTTPDGYQVNEKGQRIN